MAQSLKQRWYGTSLKAIGKIQNKLSHWQADYTVRKFNLNFVEKPGDVFVVTYPKSGTTWMQMIMYQIHTDGNIDNLPHIELYAPHLEASFIFGPAPIDIVQEPRIFKSHMGYKYLYQGKGKYIYVLRNGMDVSISFYHHFQNYLGYRGSFDQFWQMFIEGSIPSFGSWFEHVRDFLENKRGLDMLVVRYEDLIDDLALEIRKIAAFLGKDFTDEQIERITENSRFAFMKQHQHKFDLETGKQMKMGIQKGNFIRQGKKGGWRENMDTRKLAEYQDTFQKFLQGAGLEQYLPEPGLS